MTHRALGKSFALRLEGLLHRHAVHNLGIYAETSSQGLIGDLASGFHGATTITTGNQHKPRKAQSSSGGEESNSNDGGANDQLVTNREDHEPLLISGFAETSKVPLKRNSTYSDSAHN